MTDKTDNIDICEYNDSGELVESNKVKTFEKWDDFDIKPELLRGIYSVGFENPSAIQKRAIQPIIDGRDILGQAQSGCGKTATFSIGILQRVNTSIKKTQAIIISPTHELSLQTYRVIQSLSTLMPELVVKTLFGGTSVMEDAQDLKTNTPHIIVGCSGRIYDMAKRKYIHMEDINIFALDEADEMLSRGFKDQIYNIFQFLNENVQVALFSATMPSEVIELSKKFLRNPVHVTMKAENLTLECITQYFVALPDDHIKYDTVKDLFGQLNVGQCIIYVNSIKRVTDLYQAMIDEGFSVCCIHSSMQKDERTEAFNQFRIGSFRVLISSDITARGIDIQQVSTVINFDIPKNVATYLHRIGRSGRWGRKGMAINFVTRRDIYLMKNIEQHYKISIAELPTNFSNPGEP